jgi:hypothetical protein
MLLEAIMHGKPIIMFVPNEDQSEAVQDLIKLGMKLPHFAEFWGAEGIDICARAVDLTPSVSRMLTEHQGPAVHDSLMAHARDYVVMDGPRYPDRLAALAEELTGGATDLALAPRGRAKSQAVASSARA